MCSQKRDVTCLCLTTVTLPDSRRSCCWRGCLPTPRSRLCPRPATSSTAPASPCRPGSCHVISCHEMFCHVMSCVMSCYAMSCHLVAQVQLAPAGECDGGRHRGAAAHTGAVTLYACRNQGSPCRFMFQLSQLQLAVSHGAAKQIRQLAGEEGLDLGLPLRGQVTCRRVGGVWQCS